MSIDGKEKLSRFVLDPKHVYADGKTVKHRAFRPAKGKPLSVFRISTIDNDKIWQIGENIVAKPRGGSLYGRADFFSQDIYDLGHNIEPEKSTHFLHANIPLENWEDDMALLANALALRSKFIKKE